MSITDSTSNPLTEFIELPFTDLVGEPTEGLKGVLYEFIANALDASNAPPQIHCPTATSVVICDNGSGIEERHFFKVGRTADRNIQKHGSHGMGLKDAIACCVRKGWPLNIQTGVCSYTFERRGDNHDIFLGRTAISPVQGTKITITDVMGAKSVVDAVKKKFLCFGKPPLRSTVGSVEVYECGNLGGGVYLLGARKEGPPLSAIYNFKEVTLDQKNAISRNHGFAAKTFKRYFQGPILHANREENFGIPIPATPSPPTVPSSVSLGATAAAAVAPPSSVSTTTSAVPLSYSSSAASLTVQQRLLRDIADKCTVQDYHVWTLSSDAREHLDTVNAAMVDLLRTVPDVSVAETSMQGSSAKNTFVPLGSDVDVVVKINGYNKAVAEVTARLKSALREASARLEDSGNRIINCTFRDVAFDLVLVDASASDEISKGIIGNLDRLRAIKNAPEPVRQKMQSFMRAAKYWSKRRGLKMMSCAIEEVVLQLWDVIDAPDGGFRVFLARVGDALRAANIKDFYELNDTSIAAVQVAATEDLALLQM